MTARTEVPGPWMLTAQTLYEALLWAPCECHRQPPRKDGHTPKDLCRRCAAMQLYEICLGSIPSSAL